MWPTSEDGSDGSQSERERETSLKPPKDDAAGGKLFSKIFELII